MFDVATLWDLKNGGLILLNNQNPCMYASGIVKLCISHYLFSGEEDTSVLLWEKYVTVTKPWFQYQYFYFPLILKRLRGQALNELQETVSDASPKQENIFCKINFI